MSSPTTDPQNPSSGDEVSLVKRDEKGRLAKGSNLNPGGRPRALAEIQMMLDIEHRSLPKMREVFSKLRAFALGESVIVPHLTDDGTRLELKAEVQADPRFMALYLAYVVGPPKPVENELPAQLQEILKDAPPEVMRYLVSALANQRR